MSKRIPFYARRERWMAVISASFQPVTVFYFARYRALETVELIDDLEKQITDIEKRLDGYISASRLIAFWKGIFHTLKALSDGYYDILLRLRDSEWTWWIHEAEDTRRRIRGQKESMIKHLVTYDWILSILKVAVKVSLEEGRPWFLKSWPTTLDLAITQRRLSYPDVLKSATPDSSEKMATELDIFHWTQNLEGELRSMILELQNLYNKGKVFEHYARNLQWTMDEERKAWEEDRDEHREEYERMWPYPDDTLKPEGLDVPGSKSRQLHFPIDGVPTWQEDEELHAIFS